MRFRTNGNEEHYHDFDDEYYQNLNPYNIYSQMRKLIPRFPDANISVEVLGRTIEYNDLVLLKVSQKTGKRFRTMDESKYVKDEFEKKIIFIVHGLSAKGFSSVPCLSEMPYFIDLLSYYFSYLDMFDIFLIPIANPDGVNMMRPFWDKNVSPQSGCLGVALDRNFNIAWNSTNRVSSCSQLYPGNVPFSEVETQVIRNIFHFYHQKIIAYINVKGGTYSDNTLKGEAVLYPKGYTDVQEDDDLYMDMKGEIEEAIRNASFRRLSVTVDTLNSWYGTVRGTSVDYASTIYGIPYALEFVMQPYSKAFNFDDFDWEVVRDSLNAVWVRIIDAVFNSIWKSTQHAER